MIVATAGHVDHGKTALIKQLTGEDTDTLAEEKRRGLTINLGFAFLDAGTGLGRIGFVDVPGHRRFINTMIAGVSSIDHALLVIAATEGPKPQTIEHLEVLRLLAVNSISVVLSFIDAVDDQRIADVRASVQTLFSNSNVATPDFFEVSNMDGRGVEALVHSLKRKAAARSQRQQSEFFRLHVDRAFTLAGTGLITTGTVRSGEVKVGDHITISTHAKPNGESARIRSLHADNRNSEQAYAGQRCALNLVSKFGADEVNRGDLLHSKALSHRAARVDVFFSKALQLHSELRHMLPVKLYIGSAKLSAKLVLAPNHQGQRRFDHSEGFVQLALDTPISACFADRFLLRDDSEEFILGGGHIVDPHAQRTRAMNAPWLARLTALNQTGIGDVITALLHQGHQEVCLSELSQARNGSIEDLRSQTPSSAFAGAVEFSHKGQQFIVNAERMAACSKQALNELGAWHKANAQHDGMPVQTLLNTLAPEQSDGMKLALVAELIKSGRIQLHSGVLALAGHSSGLSDAQQAFWKQLSVILKHWAPNIPTVSDLLKETGETDKTLRANAEFLVKKGLLLKISDRRYALPPLMLSFSQQALALAEENGLIDVVGFKTKANIGRNLSVEILEYFDTIRFTQRRDNHRVIIDSARPGKMFS